MCKSGFKKVMIDNTKSDNNFRRKKKALSKIATVIIIIVCFISIILSVGSSKITNLTRKSLTDAYIDLCDHLEENYILNDWKFACCDNTFSSLK